MKSTESVKLGSICRIMMGQSPASETYNTDGVGLPFFQGNADFGEEHPVPTKWCSKPKKTAGRGDILISVRAPIGAVNTASEECCIGRGVAALRPDAEEVNAAYLKYYLMSKRRYLESIGTGSTFTAIGKSALSELHVKLYDLDTQAEISQSFDKVSDSIRSSARLFSLLDDLVKSRFIEMFGDPNSQLETSRLEEAFTVRDDARKPLSSVERSRMKQGNLYPYYGANGVVDFINSYLSDFDALCLAEDCGSYGREERSSYIIKGKAWVNNHAHILVPTCKCNLEYAEEYFYLLDITKRISGTTRMKLTKQQMLKLPIHLPPISKQNEFSRFVKMVDKLRFDFKRKLIAFSRR